MNHTAISLRARARLLLLWQGTELLHAGGINGLRSLLDVLHDSILVNDKCGTHSDVFVLVQDPVLLAHGSLKVAQ